MKRVLVALLLFCTVGAYGRVLHGNSTPSIPFFNNFNSSNLARTRTAQAATVANSADTKILIQGDSTVVGLNGTQAQSLTGQLVPLLTGASGDNLFFEHAKSTCAAYATYDSRFNPDANCTTNSPGHFGLAGSGVGENDPNTAGFHFTPAGSFDTVDIGYDTTGNGGSFTIGYNGGAVSSTISPQLSNGFQITTVTTTLGTGVIDEKNVSQSAGGWIQFMIARKSATKQQLIMNGGISGATSSIFIFQTSPHDYLNALITLGPHLVIAESGIINDWGTSVPLATSQANITAFVNALLPNTDVILTTGVPSDPTSTGISQATQVTFQQMVISLARSLGVPCVDTFGLFGDFATANGKNWMSDALHPSTLGYTQEVNLIATVLNNPNFRSQ